MAKNDLEHYSKLSDIYGVWAKVDISVMEYDDSFCPPIPTHTFNPPFLFPLFLSSKSGCSTVKPSRHVKYVQL
jgi:hypothetical protein